MAIFMVHFQGPSEDFVEECNTWEDVAIEVGDDDLPDEYPGVPVVIQSGDSEVTISEYNDEDTEESDDSYGWDDWDDDDWSDWTDTEHDLDTADLITD